MSKKEKIAVIGTGSWGTAIAFLLASCGHETILWGIENDVIDDINSTNTNSKYLPNIPLPKSLIASGNLKDISYCKYIFFVVPSQAMNSAAKNIKQFFNSQKNIRVKEKILISCTKGIDSNSGLRMSEILTNQFQENIILTFAGPSHAEEVANQIPTAISIAHKTNNQAHQNAAKDAQLLFNVDWFRVYLTDDIKGMEIAGTIKNILAIASGICVGLGLGDNAQAALITRGLAEMIRIGNSIGAKNETFMGLSGVGDLIVTCFSSHSRNYKFGKMLGEGISVEEAQKKIKMVIEGMPNTLSIYNLARKLGTRTPLIDEVYFIIYKNKSAIDSLKSLLSTQTIREFE